MNIWDKFRYKENPALRFALSFSQDCLTLMGLECKGKKPKLRYFEEFLGDKQSTKNQLIHFVETHKLYQQRAFMVLSPIDYKLLLLDLPNVAEGEIRNSLKWHVTQVYDSPLKETLFDYFLIPPPANQERSKMGYVVASQSKPLVEHVSLIESAGFQINTIDISELALHRLFSMRPECKAGAVFVGYLGDSIVSLILKDEHLYLTRKIAIKVVDDRDVGSDPHQSKPEEIDMKAHEMRFADDEEENSDESESTKNALESDERAVSPQEAGKALVEEIERSMAFCESALEVSAPSHLFMLNGDRLSAYGDAICQELKLNLVKLEPHDFVDLKKSTRALTGTDMALVGMALRDI